MILSTPPGSPYDINDLPAGTLPQPHKNSPWDPFESRSHFQLADFLYRQNQMSAGHIDELMQIWGSMHPNSPYASHGELYEVLDLFRMVMALGNHSP